MLILVGNFLTSADTPKVPDLVGNWTGTSSGHEKVGGYEGFSDYQLLLSVTEQRDRVFNGTLSFKSISTNEIDETVGFSGVIGPDMKSVYISEYDQGISIGLIISPDTLEIIYLETGKNAMAVIDTFAREVQK
jgi:hypothetical protein